MTASFDPTQMIAAIQAHTQHILTGSDLALHEAAEYVLGESTKVVPIEEGTLSGSGMTKVVGDTAGIGYGSGPAAPYAVIQHEDLTFKHDAGRHAKYLELPLMGAQQTILAIVKRHTQ